MKGFFSNALGGLPGCRDPLGGIATLPAPRSQAIRRRHSERRKRPGEARGAIPACSPARLNTSSCESRGRIIAMTPFVAAQDYPS